MKICLYTNTVFKIGGVARVVTLLSNQWVLEHDVTIICTHPDYLYDQKLYQLSSMVHVLIAPEFYKCPNETGILSQSSFEKLKQHFLQTEYDVIIAVEGVFAIALAPVIKELGALKIAWMHNSFEAYFNTPDAYLWKREDQFSKALESYDQCIVLTHQDQNDFDKAFAKRTKVILNPMTYDLKSTQPSSYYDKYFLTVCRISIRHKGLDLMIQSLPEVFKRYPEWKWILVGDGPDFETLKQLISNAHLDKNIEMVGASYDVSTYYKKASFFVLPSRWEGLAMVSLEAMAFGLPIVGFQISALKEVLGETFAKQWLVDPYDTELLAQKIIALIETEEREALGESVRQQVSKFSIENIIKAWSESFKKE